MMRLLGVLCVVGLSFLTGCFSTSYEKLGEDAFEHRVAGVRRGEGVVLLVDLLVVDVSRGFWALPLEFLVSPSSAVSDPGVDYKAWLAEGKPVGWRYAAYPEREPVVLGRGTRLVFLEGYDFENGKSFAPLFVVTARVEDGLLAGKVVDVSGLFEKREIDPGWSGATTKLELYWASSGVRVKEGVVGERDK
jgi:hypothetical protein